MSSGFPTGFGIGSRIAILQRTASRIDCEHRRRPIRDPPSSIVSATADAGAAPAAAARPTSRGPPDSGARASLQRVLNENGQEPRFNLILMDIQMPEIDGLEVTRRLRQQRYQSPIVALTAHAMPVQKAECLKAGCDEYISKPFEPDDLVRVVSKHCR